MLAVLALAGRQLALVATCLCQLSPEGAYELVMNRALLGGRGRFVQVLEVGANIVEPWAWRKTHQH